MKIELLNDMYLEPQKSGGYSLYKRYTTRHSYRLSGTRS